MRPAVLKAMLLGLIRDPAALAMGFVLPAAVFLIFALIFAGASGGSLAIRLAVLDLERSAASERFVDGVRAHPQIDVVNLAEGTSEEVTALVRSGDADVGIVVRGGARTLASASAEGPPPILLITDPTREIAVAVAEGIVQDAYFRKLPDVVIGSVDRIVTSDLVELDPAQQARLDAALEAIADQTPEPDASGGGIGVAGGSGDREAMAQRFALPFERLVERRSGFGNASVPTSISYYAGAVAIMFLLFSAMNGGLSLLQEKQSGLLARFGFALGWIGEPAEFPAVVQDRFGVSIIVAYVLKETPFIALMVLALWLSVLPLNKEAFFQPI